MPDQVNEQFETADIVVLFEVDHAAPGPLREGVGDHAHG